MHTYATHTMKLFAIRAYTPHETIHADRRSLADSSALRFVVLVLLNLVSLNGMLRLLPVAPWPP